MANVSFQFKERPKAVKFYNEVGLKAASSCYDIELIDESVFGIVEAYKVKIQSNDLDTLKKIKEIYDHPNRAVKQKSTCNQSKNNIMAKKKAVVRKKAAPKKKAVVRKKAAPKKKAVVYKKNISDLEIKANSYIYKSGAKYVFLNRKDEKIKTFSTHNAAKKYAMKNIKLIDLPIKKKAVVRKKAAPKKKAVVRKKAAPKKKAVVSKKAGKKYSIIKLANGRYAYFYADGKETAKTFSSLADVKNSIAKDKYIARYGMASYLRKTKIKATPKKRKTTITKTAQDARIQAKPRGKRTSATGKVYYESRRNRSDKGRWL